MLKHAVLSFTLISVLLSSACQTPTEAPIHVSLLNVPQQGSEFGLQSMSMEDETAENPISRQEIDPLTRYVESYNFV